MGSTMASYKYTHRGFSTLDNTPTHILVVLHKYTVRLQMNVCLDEHETFTLNTTPTHRFLPLSEAYCGILH